MTDQIPADKVREITAAMRAAMRRDTPGYSDWACLSDMSRYVRDLENLLPAPPLPTLADVTLDERAECRWMQCDVEGRSMRYVIANPHENDGEVTLIDSDGGIDWVFPEYVTPRPDLPRLEWPSADQKPAPAPAPPNTLTEGSEWDNVDALARACRESGRDQIVVIDNSGGAYIWDEKAGWWEGSASPKYDPFTILHAGLEADQ